MSEDLLIFLLDVPSGNQGWANIEEGLQAPTRIAAPNMTENEWLPHCNTRLPHQSNGNNPLPNAVTGHKR